MSPVALSLHFESWEKILWVHEYFKMHYIVTPTFGIVGMKSALFGKENAITIFCKKGFKFQDAISKIFENG